MEITNEQKHVLKKAVNSSLSSTSKNAAPLAKVAQKASELGFDYKQTGAKRFLDVLLELPRQRSLSPWKTKLQMLSFGAIHQQRKES
jgi:hypothetical protein